MMKKEIVKSEYRPEIDGLRAIAIIAVIINHFNEEIIPSGYLGVDIFFVISGYVITLSLARKEYKSFSDFISSFYERRIKRLLPALLFFVLITSLLISLFDPFPSGELLTGVSSIFGISNIALFLRSKDYFATANEFNPFMHTWSLSVEEQFYFFFPFLIWFTGFGRKKTKGARNLLIVIIVLSIVSLISFISFYKSNTPAAYFLMTSRFWEIAVGCMVFLIHNNKNYIPKNLEKITPEIVFFGIILVMFLPIQAAVPATIVIVLFSALLIICLNQESTLFQFLSNKKVVYIGLISYSLYLWHWGIFAISRWTIGISWKTIPLQLLLILCMSVISYEVVEKRFRNISWSNKRWRSIAKGILSSFLVVTISISTGTIFKEVIYQGERSRNRPINPLPDKRFFIIGDSHAYDILNLLKHNKSYKTINMVIPGCHFYSPLKNCKDHHLIHKERLIKEAKQGDIVLLASGFFPGIMLEKDEINLIELSSMQSYLKDILDIFEKRGIVTIFKMPHPEVKNPEIRVGNGLICRKEKFRQYIDPGCKVGGVSKKDFLEQRKFFSTPIKEFGSQYKNLIFWDITSITCPDSQCFPGTENKQYTVDDHHLFITSPNLSDSLLKDLNKILSSLKEKEPVTK